MTTAKFVPKQTLRQAEIVAWATGMAITPEAFAERDQIPTDLARERLEEAVVLGFLDRKEVLVGYPSLYLPTAAGRQLARKHEQAGGYRYPKGVGTPRITIKEARHTIACAGVRAALEHRYPGHRVIGVRELLRDEREHGNRLATIEISGRYGRRSHTPDLVIWPPSADGEAEVPLPVAVEVELTNKSKEVLEENCRDGGHAILPVGGR